MNILLVYPRNPETFWSFQHVLRFVAKRSAFPPLGLLTVASMLPRDWNQRLVDLNVRPLTDADLRWADYVLLERDDRAQGFRARSRRACGGARQDGDRRRAAVHYRAPRISRRSRTSCSARPRA